jgi:hypothetical protein
MAGHNRQPAQDFVDWQRHADHTGGTDEKFSRLATQAFRGVVNGAKCCGVTGCSRGAIGVAGIYDHGAHAAFGFFQVLARDDYRGGDYEILREDGGSARGNLARKHGEVEGTGFFQAAGRGRETKATWQGRF